MGQKQKILLVEDNPDLRRLFAIGLNQRGFEVKLAANGAEAVERAASERPDYILLDWLMPLMNGREVVERLDQHGDAAAVPIIVVSGEQAPDELPARVASWLTKPLTVDDLVSELARTDAFVH